MIYAIWCILICETDWTNTFSNRNTNRFFTFKYTIFQNEFNAIQYTMRITTKTFKNLYYLEQNFFLHFLLYVSIHVYVINCNRKILITHATVQNATPHVAIFDELWRLFCDTGIRNIITNVWWVVSMHLLDSKVRDWEEFPPSNRLSGQQDSTSTSESLFSVLKCSFLTVTAFI